MQIKNSAGTVSPLINQVGSTTALTNSTGKVATNYSIRPFGKHSRQRDSKRQPRAVRG